MNPIRFAPICAVLLAACTSLDAREPSKPVGATAGVQGGDTKGTTDPKPQPKPEPETTSSVAVAVASVLLESDCPDPEPPPVSPADTPAPQKRSMPASPPPASMAAPRPLRPGEAPAVGYRRACEQSTLQLRFTNTGKAEAEIRIASIQLHDVQTKSVLAPVRSRLPSAWNDGSAYEPWDERLAAGAEFHASYRLTPPDWSMVESKLGAGSSRGREMVLEITVEIDGKPVTVRSPAFSRAPERVMPPT